MIDINKIIAELEELKVKASPGPWVRSDRHNGAINSKHPDGRHVLMVSTYVRNSRDKEQNTANEELVLAMYNYLSDLIVEIEHLKKTCSLYAEGRNAIIEQRKEALDRAKKMQAERNALADKLGDIDDWMRWSSTDWLAWAEKEAAKRMAREKV